MDLKTARLFGVMFIALILMASSAFAHSDESEIGEGREIVESGQSCDTLTGEQLEAVGEYVMELMHPGEAHELVHQRMGIQEDTDYHERFHMNLAQSMYCGDMPMAGMMGVMGWWNNEVPKFGWGRQMMGSGSMMRFGYRTGASYWSITGFLYLALLVGIVGLVYFWLIRLWKGTKKGKR